MTNNTTDSLNEQYIPLGCLWYCGKWFMPLEMHKQLMVDASARKDEGLDENAERLCREAHPSLNSSARCGISVVDIAQELARADLDDPGSEDWKHYVYMATMIMPYVRQPEPVSSKSWCIEHYPNKCLCNEQSDEFSLLGVLADIRQKTGVGDKPMLSELADTLAGLIKRESGSEREIYNTIHVNFLRHCHSEEGLAMMEKYLRYRAASYSHEESERLMVKPYHEAANDMRPKTEVEV